MITETWNGITKLDAKYKTMRYSVAKLGQASQKLWRVMKQTITPAHIYIYITGLILIHIFVAN